ncbi:MAG: Mur ligase family protein [Erysipelotrichaceae bacterium]|nr:Mur ligase family protein [Erysipelotrichaceae bacterium]
MFLNQLFDNAPEIEINQLSIDSRMPMKNCIFFCLSGIKDDGHNFIKEAISNGATVVVYENDIQIEDKAIFIRVSDVAACLNHIAAKFYDYPAKSLDVFVSSGSEGVSSLTYTIYKLLNNYKKTGSIGSRGIYYNDNHLVNNSPTLTILDNQKFLRQFVDAGVKAVCLEADVLALSYKKLDAVNPDVFIYNLTNNRSNEYREVGNNYFDILCSYLYTLDEHTIILLNRDDISYNELTKASSDNTYSFGLDENSDFRITNVQYSRSGTSFHLSIGDTTYCFNTILLGLNNVYNIVAAVSALYLKGYSIEELQAIIPTLKPIRGDMELIDEAANFNVIVDDANNMNSIEDVLKFAKEITLKSKKIYAIWGVNSSDGKNTYDKFVTICEEYLDQIILTEMNTYSGSLDTILNTVYNKFTKIKKLIIEDRKVAIEMAIDLLNDGDTLLILGKGNQNFIIRNMGKEPYSGDNMIALNHLKEMKKQYEFDDEMM